jgi:hypothetical protein
MRTVIGAVYGALLAALTAVVLDVLVSGALLSPEGAMPSWYGSVRNLVAVIMICVGLAWGARKARRRHVNAKA